MDEAITTIGEINKLHINRAFDLRRTTCTYLAQKESDEATNETNEARKKLLVENIIRNNACVVYSFEYMNRPFSQFVDDIPNIKNKKHEELAIELSNLKHVIDGILFEIKQSMIYVIHEAYDDYSKTNDARIQIELAISICVFCEHLKVVVLLIHELNNPTYEKPQYNDDIPKENNERTLRIKIVTLVPQMLDHVQENNVVNLVEMSTKLTNWQKQLVDFLVNRVDDGANNKIITFDETFSNSILSDLIKTPFCINQDCVLSHKLSELDPANFGKFYIGKQSPTNLFPRICRHCLLGKFGLYEAYVDVQPFAICHKLQAVDNKDVGPFLKASKAIVNLVNPAKVVFPSDTIILPAGQILLELLMADPEYLYNIKKKIPVITHDQKDYFLNHYIYGYFKYIHEIITNPANSNREKPNQMKTLDDVLWCENLTNSIHPLQVSAEVDAIFMSHLVQPTGSLSGFIVSGESSTIDETKELNINIIDDVVNTPELVSDKRSRLVRVEIKNPKVNIHHVNPTNIQLLNQILSGYLLTVKQLILNRKSGLNEYFNDNVDSSAIQLHISSFCLPFKIMRGTDVLLQYQPNCKYIPGLGLVSISTICEGDLLIVERTVNVENFKRLKMSKYEESMIFNELNSSKKDTYPGQLSYLWESKIPATDKGCMYSNV